MEYKGYRAVVQFDDEAGIFHGDVVGIWDVITFQGESVAELRQAFKDSVNHYLDFCAERGREPSKPHTGQVTINLSPDLHCAAAVAAAQSGRSLDEWLTHTVARAAAAMY